MRLLARVAHACIEGSIFIYTSPGQRLAQVAPALCTASQQQHRYSTARINGPPQGFRTFFLVQNAALLWYVGPKQSVPIACKAVFACSLARGLHVLASNGSSQQKPEEEKAEDKSSLWDWTPPGDLAETGAWKVLRELAMTLSKSKDHMPALSKLEPLPTHELAIRLFYLYDHFRREPVVDEFPGGKQADPDLVDKLAYYLWFAEYAYEAGTEPNLKKVLQSRDFHLNFAKMNATWGEHEPAYYVATHTEKKEVVVAIRGTWAVEDVITDITALPVAFNDGKQMAHSGMNASALYLFDRLFSLAKAVRDEYQVTLVGHSLGAGAAALLALMLRAKGITNMHCYAFAPPMCCEPDLAASCSDYVTSIVFRDDIISRISQEGVVALYEELSKYDWQAASKNEETHPELRKYTEMLRTVAGSKVGSWLGLSAFNQQAAKDKAIADAEDNKQEGSPRGEGTQTEDAEDQGYNPLVPGRVVYIYRTAAGPDGQPGLGRVLTDGTCSGLRRIHLSGLMLKDHLTDSYFEALGSTNPTKEDKSKQK
ncbi:hypothetical protein WJX77_010917 [Trebouxia sp. C0004]